MLRPKIGLLPFYIALYDQVMPELRTRLHAFLQTIKQALQDHNVDVVLSEPCCIRSEFQTAIKNFEDQQVCAIVSLHLAYSPSLESADLLAETTLPLIILDTTPAFSFGPSQKSEELMFNHGIHGVQDLCNLLIRRGKPFVIESGHWLRSDVILKIHQHIMAAALCQAYGSLRIGILGDPFTGMGDFQIPRAMISDKLGFTLVPGDFSCIGENISQLTEEEIKTEIGSYADKYASGQFDSAVMRRAVMAGLALRKWLEKEQLSGFTINFMNVDKNSRFTAMPFLEISQAMARGLGYAGEGDVLTASLMSILARLTTAVSFVEMFCPDWQDNSIFLSHMGEANPALMSGKPVLSEIAFQYTDVGPTVAAFGAFRAGPAALVNLAPVEQDQFRLIITPGTMLDAGNDDNFTSQIRGWFQPTLPLADYLAQYSRLGGTHHSVAVYDADIKLIQLFGAAMGWQVRLLAQS